MAFTTAEDYKALPYVIPNVDAEDLFPTFIAQEEENALYLLLGSSLYDSFIAGLAALPNMWLEDEEYFTDEQVQYGSSVWTSLVDSNSGNVPIEGPDWTLARVDKWLELQNGSTYLYSAKQYRWVGMVKLLQPLVYYRWVEDNQLFLTGSGIVTSSVENSEKADPRVTLQRAWLDYGKKAGMHYSQVNTLYGYIKSKQINDTSVFDGSFDPSFGTLSEYLFAVFNCPGFNNEFDL